MERIALRWMILALALLAFWKWGLPALGMGPSQGQHLASELYRNTPDFAPDRIDPVPPNGAPVPAIPFQEELCRIQGVRFEAELSTRGAALTHLWLRDAQYAASEAADLSTTPDHERWRSLRTLFRTEGADDQMAADRFLWKLETHSPQACRFLYEDPSVRVQKTVSAGETPFSLHVETTLTNRAHKERKHRFSVSTFAFRRNEEVKGQWGRASPFQTELLCTTRTESLHKSKGDFNNGWLSVAPPMRYVAIANTYFAQALIPLEAAEPPACQLLAEDWFGAGQRRDDDKAATVYHASLAYPPRTLAPGESVTYRQQAFFGPKEREVLAKAQPQELSALLNLGFFSPIAKTLVNVLLFLHSHVTAGSWGLAIVVLTFCVRLLLFPLTWKSIRVSIGMRKLKPELDALHAQLADQPQAKNIATMELYRKHGINPLSGCLPQLIQMPIWFAMYTTLQTAVEMYHTHFLWFSDLSAPDHLYLLPLVLGATMIVQQRLVPQQGMDPLQQKMMSYLLPALFTGMMLFLPAALGIYMLTSSVLGICQQVLLERLTSGKKGALVPSP